MSEQTTKYYQTGYGEYFLTGGTNGTGESAIDIIQLNFRSFDGDIKNNKCIIVKPDYEGLTDEQKRVVEILKKPNH